ILLIDNNSDSEHNKARIRFASIAIFIIAIISAALFWILLDYRIISFSGPPPLGQSGTIFAFVGIVVGFRFANGFSRLSKGTRVNCLGAMTFVVAIFFGPIYFLLEFIILQSISPRIVHTASVSLGFLSAYLFLKYEGHAERR
ncbi:MAG: hypothetical protein JRN15_23875, partial [Nitrososphaerota archaeon]|nr:hypothetical protein [Nitrososphaerota archaeon]